MEKKMNCAVCYEDKACTCRLSCRHTFCRSCITEWYIKGNGGCPMCRQTICFPGIWRLNRTIKQTRWRAKADSFFEDAFDWTIDMYPTWFAMGQLKELESTYRILIHEEATIDDIEYVMYMSDEYYFSSRRLTARVYYDEPVRETYFSVRHTSESREMRDQKYPFEHQW